MAKKAASEKQEAKQDAFDALKGPKQRSIIIDMMVFCGGIGSLVWVLREMAAS
ncbi:hypothetical protein [Caulobacter sp. 1776]|uniref:hypothetical protein n=1 Tax=Caulobacter sp. 1776 TaxID=3156420 RepID=UPI00339B5480